MDPELEQLQGDPDEQAGFDDDTEHPTERPDDDEPPREPERTQDAPPEPEVEYAQLTKAEVEELRARAALVEELKATQDKSFGTFGRTIKGLQDTLAQFQAGAQVEISQADIDALKEDFPPMAAALQKVRDMRALPAGGLDPNRLDEIVQQRIAPALTAVEQKFELRLLAKDHPDYQQIDRDPAFGQWVAAQPVEFRNELARASAAYDSEVVSAAMSKFKAFRKQAGNAGDPTRTSRFSAAVTPRGSGATRHVGNDERSGFDAA